MLEIILHVDAPPGAEQGAKEAAAMALEHLGGVRVVSVKPLPDAVQIGLFDIERTVCGKRWRENNAAQ